MAFTAISPKFKNQPLSLSIGYLVQLYAVLIRCPLCTIFLFPTMLKPLYASLRDFGRQIRDRFGNHLHASQHLISNVIIGIIFSSTAIFAINNLCFTRMKL